MTDPTTPVPAPTQEKHPGRSSLRTAFQVLVALATVIPYFVTEANIPVEGWVGSARRTRIRGPISRGTTWST